MALHLLHYSLHFLFPVLLARILFRNNWKSAAIIMLGTMAIDLDHLLATPIYDPGRCSLGFHPLHSSISAGFYAALLIPPKWYLRALSTGLLFHLATDGIVCLLQ